MADSAAEYLEIRWRVKDSDEAWSAPHRVGAYGNVAVKNLDANKLWEFEARAVSNCGAASVWVPSDYSPPSMDAPPQVTSLTAQSLADGVHLGWTFDYPWSGIKFVIERSTAATSGFIQRAEVLTTAYTDPETTGTTYYYRVRATSQMGGPGDYSNVVSSAGVSVDKIGDDVAAAQQAATDAQASADTALGKLADIASDDILSSAEKPVVMRDYAVITTEQPGIDAQADAYGITTVKTNYDTAVSALTTYLSGLPTTPAAWNDKSGNTTIVGSTFRSKFAAVYTTRQTLLNAIYDAVKAASKAYTDDQLTSYVEQVTYNAGINNLQNQIDGQVDSYFEAYDPTPDNAPANSWTASTQKHAHLNDTFTNVWDGESAGGSGTPGASWKWVFSDGVFGWSIIGDTATQQALQLAGVAQDTADGKRRNFSAATPTPPYDIGDTWTTNGKLYVASTSKATGTSFAQSDWTLVSDITSQNTAADTSKVGGVAAGTVRDDAASGSSALSGLQNFPGLDWVNRRLMWLNRPDDATNYTPDYFRNIDNLVDSTSYRRVSATYIDDTNRPTALYYNGLRTGDYFLARANQTGTQPADTVDETATRKWAGESGADLTSMHQAASAATIGNHTQDDLPDGINYRRAGAAYVDASNRVINFWDGSSARRLKALAGVDGADWSTQVTGTGKPADNADVTASAKQPSTWLTDSTDLARGGDSITRFGGRTLDNIADATDRIAMTAAERGRVAKTLEYGTVGGTYTGALDATHGATWGTNIDAIPDPLANDKYLRFSTAGQTFAGDLAATKNQSDSYLLSRANATGTQPLATISDAGELAGKDKASLDGDVTDGTNYRRTGSGYVDASGRVTNVWDGATIRSGSYLGTGAANGTASLGHINDLATGGYLDLANKRINKFYGQGALATKSNVSFTSGDVTDIPTPISDGRVGLAIDLSGKIKTGWYTARKIAGVDFDGTANIDVPLAGLTGRTADNITYTGGATVDSLKPSQANADHTGSNTAADTSKVNGVAAATVSSGAADGVASMGHINDLSTAGYLDLTNKRVLKFYGQGALATKNTVSLASTDITDKATSYLTDDAGLGTKATWAGVTGTGKPADNADVTASAKQPSTWLTDSTDIVRGNDSLTRLSGRVADNIAESTGRKWAGESGATVGADWLLNLKNLPGSPDNMVHTADFESGDRGAWSSGSVSGHIVISTSGYTRYLAVSSTSHGEAFKTKSGAQYYIEAWSWNNSGVAGNDALGVSSVDADGNILTNQYAFINTTSHGWQNNKGIVTLPAGAVSAQVFLFGNQTPGNYNAYTGITCIPLAQALILAGSGARLGDLRNQVAVGYANFGAGWSGGNLSYTASSDGTATISASAATLQAGSVSLSYSASSTSVSGGSAGQLLTYYLYYDDPDSTGGAKTLHATTSQVTALANDGRVSVGQVAVAFPSSGSGSGGGSLGCLMPDMYVMIHRGSDTRVITAGELAKTWRMGDYIRAVDPVTGLEWWQQIDIVQLGQANGVTVTTGNGCGLTCTDIAWLGQPDGTRIRAQDTQGQMLYTRAGASQASVTPAGMIDIIKIMSGGVFFLASSDGQNWIAHHNMKPTQPITP